MRGEITARAGIVTVSHVSIASKPHVCGSCGGPIGEGDPYLREESIDAKIAAEGSEEQPDFWRRWGRVPHDQKEIGLFHENEHQCEEWLLANSEPVEPQAETLWPEWVLLDDDGVR